MHYDKGKHTIFHHRYHIIWITKYRYKVLTNEVGYRIRDLIRQICDSNDIQLKTLENFNHGTNANTASHSRAVKFVFSRICST